VVFGGVSPKTVLVLVLLATAVGLPGMAAASASSTQPALSFASGKIAQVMGSTLEVQGTSGQTSVMITSATKISRTKTLTASEVAVGSCVTATGTAKGTSTLVATDVSVLATTSKSATGCTSTTRGTGAGGRTYPTGGGSGSHRGGSGGSARPNKFSSAFGAVTAKSTAAIELHGRLIVAATSSKSAKAAALTDIKIELSKSSHITATVPATSAALLVGQCLTAVGPVNDIGVLTARSVTVTAPTSEGCTAGGFRGA
jgi:hypothetical protein